MTTASSPEPSLDAFIDFSMALTIFGELERHDRSGALLYLRKIFFVDAQRSILARDSGRDFETRERATRVAIVLSCASTTSQLITQLVTDAL